MFRPVRLAAFCTSLALLLTVGSGLPAAAAGTGAKDTPVVFVHGFYPDKCPSGLDVAYAMSGPTLELAGAAWTGRLDVVSYYACDQGGSRIGSDTTGTSIRRIGAQLARYIYRTYTVAGQPVDIVAHSMGGLIVRTAMALTAGHAQGFPPALLVHRVVTFSTPYDGVSRTAIGSVPGLAGTRQARQVHTGSAFLSALSRRPTGNAAWLAVGSSGGCDLVPGASAVGMPHATRIRYTGCWTHTQYLFDRSQTRSFPAYRNGVATVTYGPLELMSRFLG